MTIDKALVVAVIITSKYSGSWWFFFQKSVISYSYVENVWLLFEISAPGNLNEIRFIIKTYKLSINYCFVSLKDLDNSSILGSTLCYFNKQTTYLHLCYLLMAKNMLSNSQNISDFCFKFVEISYWFANH